MGRYSYVVERRNVINCVSCHLLVRDRPPWFQIYFFLLHAILKLFIYFLCFSLALYFFRLISFSILMIPSYLFTYSFWFLTFFHLLLFSFILYFLLFILPFFLSHCIFSSWFNFCIIISLFHCFFLCPFSLYPVFSVCIYSFATLF
jgi:hypothetical protein